MAIKDVQARAIGSELAHVLPNDGVPWYKKKQLLRLNYVIFCLVLFTSANGYDASMMNGLQALPQWQKFMSYPTGAWLGFINGASFAGSFILLPVAAWTSNRFGRKKTIAIGYLFLVLSVALQTAAKNPAMFVLGRLFLGGPTSFFSATTPVLITETAFPTHRGIATSLANCGWFIGSLLAAWVTYGTRNYGSSWAWRLPTVFQLLIPAIAFTGYIIAPESPRWLVSKGRIDEARAFLVKYHADGDEHSLLAEFELEEITKSLALEKEYKQSTTYLDMVRTKGNRHRLFITITLGVFAQWNGNNIVSYYLAAVLKSVGVTSVTNQTMISGFLQIWNLIIATSAAFSVDRLGRRTLFLTSSVGMLVSYVFITGLSGSFATTAHAATGVAVIPFLFIFYAFYASAFTPLLLAYPCEIWPYQFRSRGVAVTLISTGLAVFFNIFVNPIAFGALEWKYYLIYVAILIVVTLTVYFFYPETNGHSLEEMARIFDGDKAAVPDEVQIGEAIAAAHDKVPGVMAQDISHVENTA